MSRLDPPARQGKPAPVEYLAMRKAAESPRPRLTLALVFVLSSIGLVVALFSLFYVIFATSESSVLRFARDLRDETGLRLEGRVESFLDQAGRVVEQFHRGVMARTIDPQAEDLAEAERGLFSLLLANDDLGEVALTRRDGQLAVFRVSTPAGPEIITRHIYPDGQVFKSRLRNRVPGGRFDDMPWREEQGRIWKPPSDDPTFTNPAEGHPGKTIWSDLHASQIDDGRADGQRRVVVSALHGLVDENGRSDTVIRVGLLAEHLDEEVLRTAGGSMTDDHRSVFICDSIGLLITRPAVDASMTRFRGDGIEDENGDYLRFRSRRSPKQVVRVLTLVKEAGVRGSIERRGDFDLDGERYLYNLRNLDAGQDWVVGIVAPESFYLGDLDEKKNRLWGFTLGLVLAILAGGLLTLWLIRRSLATVIKTTRRMEDFCFDPDSTSSMLRETSEVLRNLEAAKTTVRSMAKYVPLTLVRKLYADREEPSLGGSPLEVTLMFTDIAGFTTIAEQTTCDELAVILGHYFGTMAAEIHAESGTIDKYIGDAVMAFWNAPLPIEDHPLHACRAALRCVAAIERLESGPSWDGRPRLFTRFGLHTAEVLVGNFGAPDRMNFTALGDGVNVAARLEGINKLYGTQVIVSETVAESVRGKIELRRLDLVAVKGKSTALEIYELLGESGAVAEEIGERARHYERAFAAYLEAEFESCIELLNDVVDDPPSLVLAARCRELIDQPPGSDWNGVFVAKSK